MRIEIKGTSYLTQDYLDLLQGYELETTIEENGCYKHYIIINSLEELFKLAIKIREIKLTNDELIITYGDYRKKDDIILEIYNNYRE